MKISLISVDGHVSLGIRYLSSKLKADGHNVKLIFLPYMTSEVYSKQVLNGSREICVDSDIIGISSMAYSSNKAMQIATFLKDLDALSIWGGVFPTIYPDICLKYVDIVCIGEGEEAISELVHKIVRGEDFKNTMNFSFNNRNGIIRNPVRPLIQDLDSVPFPDYDLSTQYILENNKFILMEERHFLRSNRRFGGFTVFNMRGCPYSCTYCINNALKELYPDQKVIRKNSIQYVIEQMKEIKKRFPSVERIRIDDDSFFVRSPEEIRAFAGLYKKEVNLPFECNTDPLTISEEKMELLVNSGLKHIVMGVQSGSARISGEIFARPFTREVCLKAAKIINGYYPKLEVTYDFIVLNPFEKEGDIIETLDLIKKLPKPFYNSINCMAFFPGSRIYKMAQDAGIRHNRLAFAQKGAWTEFGEIRKINRLTENKYLNLITLLIDGEVNSKKFGKLPNGLFNLLINKRMIKIFNRDFAFATYTFVVTFKLIIFIFVKLVPRKLKSKIKRIKFERIVNLERQNNLI